MNFVIISGQSGAGKSQAKKVFEDLGYYCVDNLPPSLIPSFLDLIKQSTENITHIALVIDIRGGQFFKDLERHLTDLEQHGYPFKIFYFEASESVLLKRFKETRRTHPLEPSGRIEDVIKEEIKRLEKLRTRADYVIDTSETIQAQLKHEIERCLDIPEAKKKLSITILSFGFKKGIPMDSDFLFDVRFLPNPFYLEALRHQTGNDHAVSDYVMSFKESDKMLTHIKNMMDFAIPHFETDGRSQLVIAVGCTGGQHRSVTFANLLGAHYKLKGYTVHTIHRDIHKGVS